MPSREKFRKGTPGSTKLFRFVRLPAYQINYQSKNWRGYFFHVIRISTLQPYCTK